MSEQSNLFSEFSIYLMSCLGEGWCFRSKDFDAWINGVKTWVLTHPYEKDIFISLTEEQSKEILYLFNNDFIKPKLRSTGMIEILLTAKGYVKLRSIREASKI